METFTQIGLELDSAKIYAHNAFGCLRSAMSGSNAITALVLMPMIARAAQLQADISALIDALNATE